MKKRIISIALLLTLLVSAGCGNKKVTSEVAENEIVVSVESSTENVDNSLVSVEESEESNEEEKTEVAVAEEVFLKDIYAEHGVKVGTCLTPSMITSTKHSDIITSQFNSVTMENAMKPDYIFSKTKSQESGELVVSFNLDMTNMLDWARENNMAVRGHTLVWYSQTPSWIFYQDFDTNKELVSREVMLERMESYIRQVFELLEEKGYSDLFYAYDVVNEAWMEDGSMRDGQNLWYKVIGEDYIWYAFYYANKYAPENIALFYNDYNEQYKYTTLVKFVKTLVDEDGNSLIDGIGLQAHLYTADDMSRYLMAVKALGATGLKLEITELDVCLGSYQKNESATDDNLSRQGRYYYSLLHSIFDMIDKGEINMDSITFWGFVDTLSWRRTASPLLYDSLFQRKPAYFGAAQLKDYAGFN